MHFDMIEYSDNLIKLWYSDAWDILIQTTLEDFAYTVVQQTIFSEDFILFSVNISLTDESDIKYNQICFINWDIRTNFRIITYIIL